MRASSEAVGLPRLTPTEDPDAHSPPTSMICAQAAGCSIARAAPTAVRRYVAQGSYVHSPYGFLMLTLS